MRLLLILVTLFIAAPLVGAMCAPLRDVLSNPDDYDCNGSERDACCARKCRNEAERVKAPIKDTPGCIGTTRQGGCPASKPSPNSKCTNLPKNFGKRCSYDLVCSERSDDIRRTLALDEDFDGCFFTSFATCEASLGGSGRDPSRTWMVMAAGGGAIDNIAGPSQDLVTTQCDHFFDGATTADIDHLVCARNEPSKLDPGGPPVRACRPPKLPENLRAAAIMDAEALESELAAVGVPACPADMRLVIARHAPPPLADCACESFPEGNVPPSDAVVCAKATPLGGALRCFSRNADYRGDDGGALTWSGCRSDMTPCKYTAVAPAATVTTTTTTTTTTPGCSLSGTTPCV